ncbi:MAG: hypothetical protein JWM95_1834 [Gemmatimonadetes bacterium]|nr:hypothetical protein [Gemmatimonadota bacterium]
MRSPLRLAAFLLCMSTAAVQGCRSANSYDMDPSDQAGVILDVKNDAFLDVDVYVIADGLATRVGEVSGTSERKFMIRESVWRAGDLRFIATPIGGNGRANSGPVNVRAGSTVFFNVNNTLRNSVVSVR